jgi:hypothetical protein
VWMVNLFIQSHDVKERQENTEGTEQARKARKARKARNQKRFSYIFP